MGPRLLYYYRVKQRVRLSERAVAVLPKPKLPLQQPEREIALRAPNTPSQRILELQRAVGNRAVQRMILSRKVGPPADASPPPVVEDKTAVTAGNKGAQAPAETARTDWYIDFWGASKQGRRAGKVNRSPNDVLVLEELKLGPSSDAKSFRIAGNALRSGRSRLTSFEHTKGPGHVNGVVKYSSRQEVNIKFDPKSPAESGPLKPAEKRAKAAAEAAAKAAAVKTVVDLTRDPDSELSGNWVEVEKKAAEAAAAELPAGSQPVVTIDAGVKTEGDTLKTTPYSIDRPSTCTINVIVPTKETTYQVSGGESTTTTVAGGVGGSVSESQKIDVGYEVKTFLQSTKTSFIETVNSLHKQITSGGGGGDIQSDEGSDLSWTDRAKKFLKEKASAAWEKAKSLIIDKAKGFLKKKLTRWVVKLLGAESYLEVKLTEWVVNWLGDKAADKLKGWLVKVHRGPEEKLPCPAGSTTAPGPPVTDPRLKQKCPTCHDRHPGPNPQPTPQPPQPQPPAPVIVVCPPVDKPPVIKSDDEQEIHTIFSDSTTEVISTAEHANLEATHSETEAGYAEAKVTRHTEHHYSGPVTKVDVGHPAIDLIIENLN